MNMLRCAGWPPPKDKAITEKMRSSNSNMNARRLKCTGLEYLDNIDLRFHKKRTTAMIQFWGYCEC